MHCYLVVGEEDLSSVVQVLSAVFLHLNNEVTILVQATEVGPVLAILCVCVCVCECVFVCVCMCVCV